MRSYTKKLQEKVTPPANSLEEFITPPLASQSISMTKEISINFDAKDVTYLASNLTSESLPGPVKDFCDKLSVKL